MKGLNELMVDYMSMKIVEHIKWESPQIESPTVSPKCFFCELLTEPTVLYRDDDVVIRGWKCPRCDFTLPHSHDIHKALSIINKQVYSSV
jgi:hypothetical protein